MLYRGTAAARAFVTPVNVSLLKSGRRLFDAAANTVVRGHGLSSRGSILSPTSGRRRDRISDAPRYPKYRPPPATESDRVSPDVAVATASATWLPKENSVCLHYID